MPRMKHAFPIAALLAVTFSSGTPAASAAPLTGPPLSQPPPSFETCRATGSGTICSGTRKETYGPLDSGIVCGSGADAFSVFDQGTHLQLARRFYDENGNWLRRELHDTYKDAQWFICQRKDRPVHPAQQRDVRARRNQRHINGHRRDHHAVGQRRAGTVPDRSPGPQPVGRPSVHSWPRRPDGLLRARRRARARPPVRSPVIDNTRNGRRPSSEMDQVLAHPSCCSRRAGKSPTGAEGNC